MGFHKSGQIFNPINTETFCIESFMARHYECMDD